MKKIAMFLIVMMTLSLTACTQQTKRNDVVTVEWNLGGESFKIPVDFKQSNENFRYAYGGPQRIRLQTDEGYYVEITESVGKFSFNPVSSAEEFGTKRVKSTKITIAGKSFYKRPLYLHKDGDYMGIFSHDFGDIKLSSQGYAINMRTGEVVDENPRHLTEYVFDLGNNVFAITLEDKIPNHEALIKIFLELDSSTATKEPVDQGNKNTFKEEEKESSNESLVQSIKQLNENLVSVKNAYADVYSSVLLGRPTVYVLFNSNNTKASMQAFLKIIDETAEQLVQKYRDYVYYAFDNEHNMVLAYQGSPSEEIFSVEGIHFYVDGAPSEMSVDCPFRRAYSEIVKEKRGVKTLTEWDYYMFRNRMPLEENHDGLMTAGLVVIGTSAVMEVAKTDWDLVFELGQFEEFIKIFEEREEIQEYVKKQGSYGIIWFDKAGKRVMAETIDKTSGKTERDRRWYNEYKEPKRQ